MGWRSLLQVSRLSYNYNFCSDCLDCQAIALYLRGMLEELLENNPGF
jgi:hypothetical protein